jgi:hypothetical protein
MGLSGYLVAKTEFDHYIAERRLEPKETKEVPEQEAGKIASVLRVYRSSPSKYLLATTVVIVAVTLILAQTPLSRPFGFCALPASFFLVIAIVLVLYVDAAEAVKDRFYKRVTL